MGLEHEVHRLLARVESEGVGEVTPRQLLRWAGAQRRGANVVATIERTLRMAGLVTQPGFEAAPVDAPLEVRAAGRHPDADPPPWVPELNAARDAVQSGRSPVRASVRTILGWFGAERRGRSVVMRIQGALDEFGLVTEPDFQSAYIDALVSLLANDRADRATPALDDNASHLSAPAVPPTEQQKAGLSTHRPPQPDQAFQPASEQAESLPAPTVALEDPTYRVGNLRTADLASVGESLVSIKPTATIQQAVTLMESYAYSQLPVMRNTRTLEGVVTWRTIGRCLALGMATHETEVSACMEEMDPVQFTDALFRIMPKIIRDDFVLVRGPQRVITGIVTTTDLSEEFHSLSEPFLLLGEIEHHIRRLIERGSFTCEELAGERAPHDQRDVSSVADLTLGECVRLLQRPEYWDRLNVRVDRVEFGKTLTEVRLIRNDVMHFDPDCPSAGQLKALRRFSRFLRALSQVGAL